MPIAVTKSNDKNLRYRYAQLDKKAKCDSKASMTSIETAVSK